MSPIEDAVRLLFRRDLIAAVLVEQGLDGQGQFIFEAELLRMIGERPNRHLFDVLRENLRGGVVVVLRATGGEQSATSKEAMGQ